MRIYSFSDITCKIPAYGSIYVFENEILCIY